MFEKKIYLSPPNMGGGEQKYIKEAFDTNWIAPLGANVNGFEQDIQQYNDIANCVVLCSGTAGLHLALIIAGVAQDDEVLCSTFTFSATANVIKYQQAIPVFIDSERSTWNMCPEQLEIAIKDRIKKGKKPKACILVHLYGMPAQLTEILVVCKKYNITLIEDAAESIGSAYGGKKTGTFGNMGIYSFNGNKIITTSGGGALVSEEAVLIEQARFLATQARDPAPHYQHSQVGYNYRLSNICAGIGRGQMEVLDKWIENKRAINNWYRSLLDPYDFISFHTEPSTNYFSNYWLTCIVIEKNNRGVARETIRLALEAKGIESRPLWKPMHLQPVFQNFPSYANGISEELFEKGLCLPSGSNLTEEQKNRIKTALLRILS